MVSPRPAGYAPERGDAVWIDFDPQSGHEQSGRRPALVVSPSGDNGRIGPALLCPVTSRVKGYPFEVAIPSGLGVTGVVLADQIKSLDWRSRRAAFVCRLPPGLVVDVLRKIEPLVNPP